MGQASKQVRWKDRVANAGSVARAGGLDGLAGQAGHDCSSAAALGWDVHLSSGLAGNWWVRILVEEKSCSDSDRVVVCDADCDTSGGVCVNSADGC